MRHRVPKLTAEPSTYSAGEPARGVRSRNIDAPSTDAPTKCAPMRTSPMSIEASGFSRAPNGAGRVNGAGRASSPGASNGMRTRVAETLNATFAEATSAAVRGAR